MKNKLSVKECRILSELGFEPIKIRSLYRRDLFNKNKWKICKQDSVMAEITESVPVFYESDVLQLVAIEAIHCRSYKSGFGGYFVHITERGDQQWEVVFKNYSACRQNLIDAVYSVLLQIKGK